MITRFVKLGLLQVAIGAFGMGVSLTDCILSGPSIFGMAICVMGALMLANGWGTVLSATRYAQGSDE